MLEATLLPSVEQIWTLEFLSAKIARSGNILLLHVGFKVQDVSNAMACTRVSITNILHSVINWTSRSILLDSKWNKENLVPTLSNTLTVRMTIKLTPICALSGNTGLIENDTWRNIKKSVKTETDQFALLWVIIKNNYKTYQYLFSKCS